MRQWILSDNENFFFSVMKGMDVILVFRYSVCSFGDSFA